MSDWPNIRELLGDDADLYEVYRVDVPYLKSWPPDQVREHIATTLHEAAVVASSVEVPVSS